VGKLLTFILVSCKAIFMSLVINLLSLGFNKAMYPKASQLGMISSPIGAYYVTQWTTLSRQYKFDSLSDD